MPPLVPSSSTERPRESEPPERHRDSALPECPLEVVEVTKNFHGGSSPPLLTETLDPPWPMRSPDPSWLPEAPDLPWPLKLPASVPETKGALSASCVSVSSRSQSRPVISAPPWWASVSSAPPWWASVSSAPPWWASVSSAPPWWAPDLPESLHVSVDLPESLHVSVDLPESLHVSVDLPESLPVSVDQPESLPVSVDQPESLPVSVDLPESLHVSVDLPESPHVSVDLPESPHVSVDLPESPHVSVDLPESPHVSVDLPESPHVSVDLPESPPPTCQSHLTPPPTCQSHLTPPPTCQSHLTPPPTCQSHLTSLLSRPPCPGGLLFHWPHMDLALRPLPRFHLRSTALLDFALCKRLEAAPRWGLCYESGSHSLKLHITHGLHFPSCTALTHSRPPLHQSHSCHHSLINSDCLTTPAPHSLTHIKAAHKHSPSAKSCFPLANILSIILPAISVFDPGLPDLGTLNLCL